MEFSDVGRESSSKHRSHVRTLGPLSYSLPGTPQGGEEASFRDGKRKFATLLPRILPRAQVIPCYDRVVLACMAAAFGERVAVSHLGQTVRARVRPSTGFRYEHDRPLGLLQALFMTKATWV